VVATLNVYEAKTRFSSLLTQVEGGEEITIARAGRPIARLVPYENKPKVDRTKAFGCLKGQIWVADDFDTWPPGFIESLTEGM